MSRKNQTNRVPKLGAEIDRHRQEAVAKFDAALASADNPSATASEMFIMMLDHLEVRIAKLPKGDAKDECFLFYKFFLEMFANTPVNAAPVAESVKRLFGLIPWKTAA